jgi:hypothetical protein
VARTASVSTIKHTAQQHITHYTSIDQNIYAHAYTLLYMRYLCHQVAIASWSVVPHSIVPVHRQLRKVCASQQCNIDTPCTTTQQQQQQSVQYLLRTNPHCAIHMLFDSAVVKTKTSRLLETTHTLLLLLLLLQMIRETMGTAQLLQTKRCGRFPSKKVRQSYAECCKIRGTDSYM